AGWEPTGELTAVFQQLPAGLTLLNVVDPRETLPDLLVHLPRQIQSGIDTMITEAKAAVEAKKQPSAPGTPARPGMARNRGPAPEGWIYGPNGVLIKDPNPFPFMIGGQGDDDEGGGGMIGMPFSRKPNNSDGPLQLSVSPSKTPKA